MGPVALRRKVLIMRTVLLLAGLLALSVPASAQIELTGSYVPLLYEDYIERGPGSDLGDFTGMPMNDEGTFELYAMDIGAQATVFAFQ